MSHVAATLLEMASEKASGAFVCQGLFPACFTLNQARSLLKGIIIGMIISIIRPTMFTISSVL